MSTNAISAPPTTRLDRLQQALPRLKRRLSDFFVHTVFQVRTYRKLYPGIMHALIFWGVVIQVLGTAINLMQMQLFIPFVELPFPRGNAYLAYELLMDLAGIAILIGVLMALFRRIVLRPETLETRWDDYLALTLLGLIPIVGFATEAARLVATTPAWSAWSPVGNAIANLLRSLGLTAEQAFQLHRFLLWPHVGLALALVASIPFTKMRHLFATPLSVLNRPLRKPGTLEKIENIEETEQLGVGKVEEFTSWQLLSFDACVRCGRCEESCPVSLSGSTYSPRSFIQSLRQAMLTSLMSPNGKDGSELLGEAIPTELPWACTTCGACQVGCPAFVNPVDEVIDLRRYLALTTGKLPKPVAEALRNMERQGNPWGIPAQNRLDWSTGLEVRELMPGEETDVLLFLGCAFAFDDRNKKVARAFVHLLQAAGVEFASLGLDEGCCGETARRLGNEYLFQVFAEQNIQTLSERKFKRIVTQCPHCYNTLKNEYPQLGGSFRVQHYTELLSELSQLAGGFSANGQGVKGRLAYQDSCYLGRYNQIYNQPRRLLDNARVDRVEMPRHGVDSFCCGGGGGQMWLETDPNTRVNRRRLEDAQQAGVDTVATACPYCLLMFDDAIRSKGLTEKMQVMDISEILERALIQEPSRPINIG